MPYPARAAASDSAPIAHDGKRRPLRRSERGRRRTAPTDRLLSGAFLVLGFVLLVQILDAVNVLDGAPGGTGPAAHGVVERLHDLVFRGAGLLRGREAGGHSTGAAGRRHGGHGDELGGLRIESPFTVEQVGKLLHSGHFILHRLGFDVGSPLDTTTRREIVPAARSSGAYQPCPNQASKSPRNHEYRDQRDCTRAVTDVGFDPHEVHRARGAPPIRNSRTRIDLGGYHER